MSKLHVKLIPAITYAAIFFALNFLLALQPTPQALAAKGAAPRQLIYSLSQNQQNSDILKVWGVPACVLMGKERPRGLYITGFTGDGLGSQLGLQTGDVLLSLNGRVLLDAKQADSVLARMGSGKLKAVFARPANVPGGISVYSPAISYTADPLNQQYISQSGSASSSTSTSIASSAGKPATAETISALEDYMFGLVNADRAANGGLPPLVKSSKLAATARKHAEDMKARNYFAHDNPDGLTPVARARRDGIMASVWENLAMEYGSTNLRGLVQRGEAQMMDEPRGDPHNHRGCILNPNHHCVGIGVAVTPNKVYCVQEFSPDDVP